MSYRLLLALSLYCLACSDPDAASAPGSEEAASDAPAREEPAVPQRKTLPDAVAVDPAEALTAGLTKLDIAMMLTNGTVQIEVNDPTVEPQLAAFFDGETSTLVKSSGINPLILTLTFSQPVRLKAARIFPSYSTSDWVLEPVPDERLLVREAANDTWSSIELDDVEETTAVRVEVLRLQRDDYVHLNEIELYG